jgi:pimeloyl-ACP methyl ester carboxylesterase
MTVSKTLGPESVPTIRLRDGRCISYLEVGKMDGAPIFHFHGHGSSRLEVLLLAEKAASLGVRLIAMDRPGIGRSDSKIGSILMTWPDDIVEMADQLGVKRFAVEGVSAGGPYALACATKIPGRLTACGLISTQAPGDPSANQGLYGCVLYGRSLFVFPRRFDPICDWRHPIRSLM